MAWTCRAAPPTRRRSTRSSSAWAAPSLFSSTASAIAGGPPRVPSAARPAPLCSGNPDDDPGLKLIVTMEAHESYDDLLGETLAHERGHNSCLSPRDARRAMPAHVPVCGRRLPDGERLHGLRQRAQQQRRHVCVSRRQRGYRGRRTRLYGTLRDGPLLRRVVRRGGLRRVRSADGGGRAGSRRGRGDRRRAAHQRVVGRLGESRPDRRQHGSHGVGVCAASGRALRRQSPRGRRRADYAGPRDGQPDGNHRDVDR